MILDKFPFKHISLFPFKHIRSYKSNCHSRYNVIRSCVTREFLSRHNFFLTEIQFLLTLQTLLTLHGVFIQLVLLHIFQSNLKKLPINKCNRQCNYFSCNIAKTLNFEESQKSKNMEKSRKVPSLL